ncbi:hypothetical protein K7X08_020954 [Anisodus acutangulus]|uniref:NADH:quinone oxidoreductase/Mrp antiporter transmembrane domain-containing protein n=1 Tax=Anisodus acutangulus TaxID=402998 RepID=A0A9Q1MZG8_9SOLA|nr:hypothetical protein K7X08_020954 [Anisodus acutangulus]
MFLVDAGLGTPRICMQDEPTGVPINRATRFENKVGFLDLVAGESLIKEQILERFFIDQVAGESLIKERATARISGDRADVVSRKLGFYGICREDPMGFSGGGLHTWSPDAMDGPTPVSALIHAANYGAMMSFLAATTGILQNDLKRLIAYSTCSQLGYMIFACGISNYSVSVFHLMNHAFFKALLFLSAGSVIHAMSDEQDMRKMGGGLPPRSLLPMP